MFVVSSSSAAMAVGGHRLSSQKSYRESSTSTPEMLAFFLSIRHFHFLQQGQDFNMISDHLPFVSPLSQISLP
jgi:hypothetical protein